MSFSIIATLFINAWLFYADHALYLSVAELVHTNNVSEASLKIKVFTNDMEDAIANEFQTRVNLSDTADFASQKKIIEKYFVNHITLLIDEKKETLSISKSQLVGDAIWFYFKVTSRQRWNQVTVTADYLMELFPTQSNVVSIEQGAEKHFLRLTKSSKTDSVKF